jgi:beta-glucosidase
MPRTHGWRRRTGSLLGFTALAACVPLALAASASTAAAKPSGSTGPGQPGQASCPWLNRSLPIAKRVHLVLASMTLANKITMVEGQGTSQPYVFFMAAQPSLCIPAMGLEDGPNGVGDGLTGVTQLPAGVALAATFDPSLAREYGQVIGSEEWGKGAAVNLGPTVNIDRDPRWGRSFESFTEDPFLNAALAVGEIGGVQSTGEMSQVKHFAAYNQETNRNTRADDVLVSRRALHEIYFPAFEQAVTRARAASVMCSYSVVIGNFSCQNRYLETTTLDQRWGFRGFTTSDYGAIHDTKRAALGGTDMEQPFSQFFGPPLKRDIQNGTIKLAVLNTMVARILTEMFRFNLFNHPPTGTTSARVTTAAHQAVSVKVAEDGTVLLKNDGPVLPLPARNGGKVAVIGPAASAAPADTGGGSDFVTSPFHVTPLAGLREAAGPGTMVSYTQGLPTDDSLPAIPSADLSPAYAPTPSGGHYTGTLTAPQTGTYVLAMTNPCGCYTSAFLSLNGQRILDVPSTPPVHTYSVAVHLVAGQRYKLAISGQTSALTWATPSALRPDLKDAVSAAKNAKTAVVVVSDDTETEAADRLTLNLPSAQNELVSAVARANPHTIVVIDAGAPVAMPWLGQVSGVVDAWYPGESNGTALASVLFGKTDPSGHLPVTFPASLSQVPAHAKAQFPGVKGKVRYSEGLDVGYRWYDAKGLTPLFPFGFGLSYTSFRYSHLRIGGPGHRRRGGVIVTATITNTGDRTGSDVAQLYLGDPARAGEPPRQLKAFAKVSLRPGQSQVVRFTLDRHDLSYWNTAASAWVIAPGTFRVLVGDSSAQADLPLHGSFTLTRRQAKS